MFFKKTKRDQELKGNGVGSFFKENSYLQVFLEVTYIPELFRTIRKCFRKEVIWLGWRVG